MSSIKSPGLVLGLDGSPMAAPVGINSKHEQSLSLMNMLKDQNKKATHFAEVMAAKVDGLKRSFQSFVKVAGPLADDIVTPGVDLNSGSTVVEWEKTVSLAHAVNEFIAVMEEQLSVGSLTGVLPK